MTLEGINWIAVLVSAVAAMIVGAAWYSSYLFGNRWLTAIGKTTREELGSPALAMVIALVGYVVMAAALAWLMPDDATLAVGLMYGFLVWLGFVAASTAIASAFEGGIGAVQWIYLGNGLVILLVMGAIIAVVG
jgi:hypothetical protein